MTRLFIPSWPQGTKSSTAAVPIDERPRCDRHPGWLAGTYPYEPCDCAACKRAREKNHG